MTETQRLRLLRRVVKLKLQYWDTQRLLEIELFGENQSDHEADTLEEEISTFAAGLDEPSDVSRIDILHLQDLEKTCGRAMGA